MSTGKPSTKNIRYNTFPSSPPPRQPPSQYYVISTTVAAYHHLPPSPRRCITTTTLLLLLFATLYLLYPSDPHLQVVHLSLNKFHVHKSPKPSLDIELALRIKIRNRDVYSLNYESLNVSVEYRGEELGFVTSENGSVRAFGTSYVNATLVLNGAEVISEVIFLIADLVKGSVPFTTTTEVKGSLGVVLFNIPISAKLSCEVVMNTYNQTIERQDCYPV